MPRDGTKRANARNTSTPASLRSRNIDQGIPTEGIPDDLSFLEVAATSPHHVLIFAIAFFFGCHRTTGERIVGNGHAGAGIGA